MQILRASAPALVGALLVAGAPAPAGAGLFNPISFTLENGLEVVVIEDHRAPVVTHMVWYRVGAADEEPGKSGLAHFLEHLMFKGTDEVAAGEFSRLIARNGGRDNAFTSQDYTGYYQSMARDKLELVMRLEADRMVNLKLDEKDVQTEREVVLEERRQRTDNEPGAQLGEAASAAQYLAHPYGIPVIGWEHEIRGLTRAAALAFYQRYYAPNNAILIVAGDVSADAVRRLAEAYYGPLKKRALPPRVRPAEPPQRAARRVVLEDARVRQPSLRRSYLAPSRRTGGAEVSVPLSIFSEILGGGSTSRLYRELVVERQLASAAGAYYSGVRFDDTTFGFYASPVPGGDMTALETALDEVLSETLEGGITETELRRAKDGLLAQAIYARDNLGTGPRIFGAALTSGLLIEDVETWTEQVETVTAEDVLRVARETLDKRRSVTSLLLPEPAS